MDKLNYLLRNIDTAKTKITTLEHQVAKKADIEHVQTINQCLNSDYATREEIFNKIDGVSYTAGDAISLVNNQISVQYDTNTMELIDGKLSTKSGSSCGGGSVSAITNGTATLGFNNEYPNAVELTTTDSNTTSLIIGNHSEQEDYYQLLMGAKESGAPTVAIIGCNNESGETGEIILAGANLSATNGQWNFYSPVNMDELHANNVYTKSEVDAKISSSGGSSGNVPTEDVYTKVYNFQLNSSSTYLYIYNNVSIKTGDIVKIRMKDKGEINEYIIIRNSEEELYDAELGGDQSNIILLNRKNDDIVRGLYNKPGGVSYKTISIPCEQGSLHEDQTGDDVGLFSTSQLSYNTLVRIMQNYYRTTKTIINSY